MTSSLSRLRRHFTAEKCLSHLVFRRSIMEVSAPTCMNAYRGPRGRFCMHTSGPWQRPFIRRVPVINLSGSCRWRPSPSLEKCVIIQPPSHICGHRAPLLARTHPTTPIKAWKCRWKHGSPLTPTCPRKRVTGNSCRSIGYRTGHTGCDACSHRQNTSTGIHVNLTNRSTEAA